MFKRNLLSVHLHIVPGTLSEIKSMAKTDRCGLNLVEIHTH